MLENTERKINDIIKVIIEVYVTEHDINDNQYYYTVITRTSDGARAIGIIDSRYDSLEEMVDMFGYGHISVTFKSITMRRWNNIAKNMSHINGHGYEFINEVKIRWDLNRSWDNIDNIAP
jgi:hypothetical protein